MDGMHDLGGKQGFGTVRFVPNAPVFHADWEVRANAMYPMAVAVGLINMDEYRYAIERMEPRHYVAATYYERSLTSVASLMVEKGWVSAADLAQKAGCVFPLAKPGVAGRTNLPNAQDYTVGDRVKVRDDLVAGHVRLPAYLRGKRGEVVGCSPSYPFPDGHAHGVPSDPEPTFDVRFRAQDLWPESADDAFVHAAIFRSYLQPDR